MTTSPLLAPAVVGTSSTTDVSVDGPTTRPLPSLLPLLGALPGSSTAAKSTHPILPVSDVPSWSVGGVSYYPPLSVSSVPGPFIPSVSASYSPGPPYCGPLGASMLTGKPAPTPHWFTGLPPSCVVAPHLAPGMPSTGPHPCMHTVVPQVKLPKLSIRKFGRDLTKWVTFRDSFDSAIHSNPSLSSVDKFNYLKSLVESSLPSHQQTTTRQLPP